MLKNNKIKPTKENPINRQQKVDGSQVLPVFNTCFHKTNSEHPGKDFGNLKEVQSPTQNKKGKQVKSSQPSQHVSYFSTDYKHHRNEIYKKLVFLNLVTSTLTIIVLAIYWGSFYNILDNLKDLKMLVVIGDENTVDGVPPIFGNAMEKILQHPQAKTIGDWHIYKESEFEELTQEESNTVMGEILKRVHQQLYWAAIYVKQNASYNYHHALVNGDTNYNASENTVAAYYESGRDNPIMKLYILPQIQQIENFWYDELPIITVQVVKNVTIKSEVQKKVFTQPLQFAMVDRAPYSQFILNAPLQIGIIQLIMVSFFQFNFFVQPHLIVEKSPVKRFHYLLYRYISSIASFFFFSLIFGLVSLAYQVDFTATYGKSGFLVYWSITFLTMCAVGLANEIVALLILPTYPPILGFWLVFWVIINVAPSYNAMTLTNNFYRYGYATPMYNGYEATKVVFFDLYKGKLGRNIGILIAWIIALSAAFPFALMRFSRLMGRRAAAVKPE